MDDKDTIYREDAINTSLEFFVEFLGGAFYENGQKELIARLQRLPSAEPDYQEILGWLLAYHTKSFDLHGRYLPNEVIAWLINDFSKEFIAERRQE